MAVATMTKSEVILEDLLAANKKYANDELTGDLIAAGAKESVRKSLENGQAPVACVVCCSDSRVPPEVIFQKGLGQLFVVRTAGNRADDDSVLGSVQYAICHLNVPLLMVLGHSSCGAMKAAIGAAKGSLPGEDEVCNSQADNTSVRVLMVEIHLSSSFFFLNCPSRLPSVSTWRTVVPSPRSLLIVSVKKMQWPHCHLTTP